MGSWNTFSRISLEDCATLLERALESGINFFDVAYYWDKPDTEAAFGRAMNLVGADRRSYLLAEKLWLWDYPKLSFREQLERSLTRLGTDHVDLVMVSRAVRGLDPTEMAEEVAALVDSGLAHGWGMTNWSAPDISRIVAQFRHRMRPLPRMVQLQYNVARRTVVESPEFERVFSESDVKLCAAFTLEGGILGGHTQRERVDPSELANGKAVYERNIARDAGGIRAEIRRNLPAFEAAAARLGVRPAQLALAFCMSHPSLATALVGITRPEDLVENVEAIELSKQRELLLEVVRPFALGGNEHPELFSPYTE